MGRFRLIPRQERFFELFAKAAANVADGAEALAQLLDDYTDVERRVVRLKDIEHQGDEITHSIYDALNRTFVTPFDRDDIGRLASALDDMLDWTEEAGRRLLVFKIEEPTPLSRKFARVIVDQAMVVREAIPLLDGLKDTEALRRHIVELHRLENEGDDLMNQALGGLYEGVVGVSDLVLAVKWGDIYEVLEQATDKGEHVGIALESILVKHA